MLYNVMSLIGAGSWNGGMKNAQTYWGLTRKIGPYKPTKYDDELAHSREPAYGHTREEFFKPAPYIQTKPYPGLFNYDTNDVVVPPVHSVPDKRMSVVGRNQYPNPNGITGKPKMRNPYTTMGTMEDKYEGYYTGSEGTRVPIGEGEKTSFYNPKIHNLNERYGNVLGKRREFHFNDHQGTINPSNAQGRTMHSSDVGDRFRERIRKQKDKNEAAERALRDNFVFTNDERRQRFRSRRRESFHRNPLNTTTDPRPHRSGRQERRVIERAENADRFRPYGLQPTRELRGEAADLQRRLRIGDGGVATMTRGGPRFRGGYGI